MTDYSSKDYLETLDKYWRATNYVSVGQLYLKDNPLLKRDIVADDLKIHPIGHWGTIAGQNFIYAHLNRVINKYNVNMFYIEGPGHGGQVMVSNSYLDGSYTEIYPEITQDEAGMKKLFKQFSFPGGIASHAAPETPGSMHEGGELGYSLSHGVGAILDNPDQIAAVVIGDGESETGPLAASWFSNVFINPVTDGAVLPILDLNGFKISNPTILSRKTDEELASYFKGLGWDPIFVEGDDPAKVHPIMAKAMDEAIEKIQAIQTEARKHPASEAKMPHWPVMIVRAPKGWTGPKSWDGVPIEGSFRAHQIPIPVDQNDMQHVDALVDWLKSYGPEELFNEDGSLKDDIKEVIPSGNKRMAMNPIVNGGVNPKDLKLPDFKNYALKFDKPGVKMAQDMIELGGYLEEVIKLNGDNFRMFGPDETMSNRLNKIFQETDRQWMENIKEPNDQFMDATGRVIDSQLSEHQAEGFLEGYVLTGRHGMFASYESFLRVVDSMLTQHFKWLRKANEQSWRNKYPSLNVIATSTAFQQDHNGYTHQDPGIITHLAEKKPEYIREYFPADTNSLLAIMPEILTSEEKINLLVTSKHPRQQFYSIEEGQELAEKGLKVIDWASNDNGDPDVVVAAAGTEPNLESLAAISILRKQKPDIKIRFVNVLDLLKLRTPSIDPRGLTDQEFNSIFTVDKPVVFAFHGFESIIKELFFDRENHNLYVHGYRENGDITTPFDMRVVNEMDRFHLAEEIAVAVEGDGAKDFADSMEAMVDKHNKFTRDQGTDLPEVEEWTWDV
ncbi:phosphoketolase family protein [Companilactobacillus metriopterae]|uniref:phosphoketolase family protein n=1 Tax=Companilactobacillus metriopterae TaxID=1909267 RepID=UPI00100AE2E7|nr:phosphoketolase family protein [Companilactobacillus metriopterae]